jgi:hypothetical protein
VIGTQFLDAAANGKLANLNKAGHDQRSVTNLGIPVIRG